MQFPEKVSKEDYELISKGTLRLFLSVDVVGSTALKQEFREQGRSWIAMAHRFFTSFPNQFSANLAHLASNGPISHIPEFELWKAIGDELVFVAEIKRSEWIPFFTEGFKNTVNEWNAETGSPNVFLKATGWLAGFPVMNSVMPGDSTSHFDYLGSSIDIGFRLGKFASPRRFVVSIELAYALAALHSPLSERFRYSGKEVLKGVLSNRPYPVLWLDSFDFPPDETTEPTIARLARLEDRITGVDQTAFDREHLKEFAEAWIESTNGELLKPFCPTEDSAAFPIPEDYREKYEAALSELEREFLEQGDIGLDDGQDDDLGSFRDSLNNLP